MNNKNKKPLPVKSYNANPITDLPRTVRDENGKIDAGLEKRIRINDLRKCADYCLINLSYTPDFRSPSQVASGEVGAHLIIMDLCYLLDLAKMPNSNGRWVWGRESRTYVRGLIEDLPNFIRANYKYEPEHDCFMPNDLGPYLENLSL
jgi:hypothetical protein